MVDADFVQDAEIEWLVVRKMESMVDLSLNRSKEVMDL